MLPMLEKQPKIKQKKKANLDVDVYLNSFSDSDGNYI